MKTPQTMALLRGVLCLVFLFCVLHSAEAQNKPGTELDGVKPAEEAVATAARLPVNVIVRESQILHPARPQMLGISQNWYWSDRIAVDDDGKPSAGFVKTLSGLRFPFTRIGGADGQEFQWKLAVGPMADRKPQKVTPGDAGSVKRMGPLEWVRATLAVDARAAFVPTLNLLKDSPEDNADLAELLCGDGKANPNGGTNWAQMRIAFGLKTPVRVVVWEVGNEMDWIGEQRFTQEQYIERCKKTIAAVKTVLPDAKFAVHAATAPDNATHKTKAGGWAGWHRAVLKELSSQIDYVVVHTYYGGQTTRSAEITQSLRDDIKTITGSNRIGIFHSEHAFYPPKPQDKSIPWSVNWYQSHALKGCLSTAQWMNQMLAAPDVIASYWCLQGGPWGFVYPDKVTGALWTTGIFDLYKLLKDALGDSVVAIEVSGERTGNRNKAVSFTATAMSTKDGGMRLLIVNREPVTVRDVIFTFDKKYRLAEEQHLSADTLDSHNTATKKNITMVTKKHSANAMFAKYAMPAKSVVVLKLRPL